ncbi:unnamed protein product, partial [Pneumocystis jirovecii]
MEQASTSNLERYYEDFQAVLSDIRNLLAEFRNCESERKKVTLQAVERAIDEAAEIESLHMYEYNEHFSSNQDLESFDQRKRLLAGTRKLEESSERLKNAQRIANETKEIGASILKDLGYQREQIILARDTLIETDGYVDRSMRTLKTMARRVVTNKFITYLIIFVLVFLIFIVA